MKTKIISFTIMLLTVTLLSSSFAQDNTQAGLPEGAIARLGKGGINIMRFSPDGTHLAVGTDVGVWLYTVPNGKETALFTGHTGHVNALAFSPDGRILASGGFNNPGIQLWDMETKNKHSTFTATQGFPNVLSSLTFYGRTLISINRGKEITYWHVDTGEKLLRFSLDNSFDRTVFSQDGSNFAVSNQVGKIHLWETTTSSRSGILKGHARGRHTDIWALVFSPDNNIFASGSEDKTVILWDTQNYTELAKLKGHDAWVTTVAFSSDGKTIASGDADKVIKLWDLESQQERATLTGHKNTINALTFAPVGTPRYGGCLASGSADGTIRFWNPENGAELTIFTTGHTEWIKAIAFSENGTTLASAAFNGTVDVWSLKTRQELMNFTAAQSNNTQTVVLSPNAKFFACRGSGGWIVFNPVGFGLHGGGDGDGGMKNLQLWDIMTGEKLPFPLQDVFNWPSAAVFSPNSNMFAISSRQEIRAWHLNTGIELFQLNAKHPSSNDELMFSPDGKKLAFTGRLGNLQIWDISTQRDITPPNIKRTSTLAFSPDSSVLATVSNEGIYLWKLDIELEEAPILIAGNLGGFKNELVFSLDGAILVGSGMHMLGNPIKLWDVETGNSLGILSGHTEPIETLVFSHDGKILASGSNDGTVLLWDWEKIVTKANKNKGN
ncbi:MAG: WD40 repeat domain-containing protein [Candidatus Poribacteria bacterium]|nr:WD40 repeat domain-containing protein [Candidatus Poribacteria bacterium]